jgi:membrane metalloprotease YhfC-like protein
MLSCFTTTTIVLASLMAGPIAAASAQEDPPASKPAQAIVGIWLGTLEAGDERVRVVFKISQNAAGALVATTDSPDRGRKDERVNVIRWQDGSLHLEGIRDRVFDGVLSQGGQELVGQWQQSGQRLALTLRRVEQAPEVAPVPLAAGLYLAAVLISFLSLLMIGGFILAGTPGQDRLFFVTVMALNLPMSAVAFHGVRLPLDQLLLHTLGPASPSYATWGVLQAPLTEELAKLWLLMLPWFRRRLSNENAPRLGMAIGLGFGVGEAWLIASLLATDPTVAHVPWYQFGTFNGYMTERFMVCIHHGAFTAAALRVIRRTPGRGILYAMGLHFVGNFPLALRGWNIGGLGDSAWAVIVQVWLILFFFAMIALLMRFFRSADPEGWRGLRHYLLGQAKCPECGLVYLRPWIAINMGTRRYEQCPGCKKWHLTTAWKEEELPRGST